jgi:hypothetical protein
LTNNNIYAIISLSKGKRKRKMKKVYLIYEAEKIIAIVSSKKKAVDYIKSCIKDTKIFHCYNGKFGLENKHEYDENKFLNTKEILNWYYKGIFASYKVEEREVL